MGENKAELLIAGEPLVYRVVHRLEPVVDELLVIGPEALQPLVPQARVVSDVMPGMGPLGGLFTALKTTSCDHIFLAACDMPFVEPGLVRVMLAMAKDNAEADAVVLQDGARAQPLHVVYSTKCLSSVERALASDNHSMRALLADLLVVVVDTAIMSQEDPRGLSAFNANTPADWEYALHLANDPVDIATTSDDL